MKKSTIIEFFGNAPRIAEKLDYTHRNVVYGWPDILTDRIYKDILRRMKYAKIKVPENWETV